LKQNRKEGVITVYLSLILLLMLALITTVLESARIQAAKACIEIAAEAAVTSAFSDYYLPLYERYHIFGLDESYGTGSADAAMLEQKICEYMEYSLEPSMDEAVTSLDLWRISIDNITISQEAKLQRDQGVLFRAEAIDYMKYKGISTAAEQLLSSLSIFKKAEDTKNLMQLKASTEEQLEEIDTCILKLFESVDGIKTNKKGIKMTWRNQIAIADSFVKKIYIGTPTAAGVGIENIELFEALQEKYTDPIVLLNEWKGKVSSSFLHLENAKNWSALAKQEEEKKDPDVLLIMEYQENETSERKAAASEGKEADKIITTLQKLNKNCLDSITDAEEILSEIEWKQKAAESEVWNYGDKLLTAVEWLDESLYKELNDSYNTMKDYIGQGVNGVDTIYDFPAMKATLEKDRGILSNINTELEQLSALECASDIDTVYGYLKSEYASYSFQGLMFDYSEVQLDSTNSSPLDGFSSFLESGIAGVIIPDFDSLSEAEISAQKLPSTSLTEVTPEEAYEISPDAANDIFGMFDGGLSLENLGELLLDGTAELSEKLLFLGYLSDHFANYSSEQNDRVLQYEQEYIICGNRDDNSNLNSIATKILVIRALFCLIQVLSDSEKESEARTFAASILGFTGMPVLISILKFSILFIWAFEEAMVETAAIMQGKKVDVIPGKQSFSVTFAELPFMGKALVQEKAKAKAEPAGLALGYQEYLMLFLLLQEEGTQNLRSLDLIQENLRAAGASAFYIGNVLYGANASIEITLPSLFLDLPFTRKEFTIEKESYSYGLGAGFAY